ncbi:MAG: SRPBCC family protein [Planctomycetes bacterium]|nr:SRPBCC family protein [Planctomycetota bacterium]
MSDDAAPPTTSPDDAPAAPEPGAAARAGRRAGAAALVALGLVFALLYVRGTRVSPTPLDPTEPARRAARQLGQGRDGPRIEAALVLDHPADAVWAVVTDYARFGETFSPPFWTLRLDEASPLDATRTRLRGEAVSRLWRFPIDIVVDHGEAPDGARVAAWDAEGQVNRGRWVVRPLGPGRTQLRYEAELRVPGYPAFLVNDLLLAEVGYLLEAVRDRLERR